MFETTALNIVTVKFPQGDGQAVEAALQRDKFGN